MSSHPHPPEVLRAIAAGAQGLSCDLTDTQVDALATFLALLMRWNRVYNLTAVRDLAEMVPRHVLDSLAVVPHLRPVRILDVGSGAGLPGLPIAIACPGLELVLLDSNAKRTRFLTQVRAELALGNVHVVRSRVQDYDPDEGFDTVISRAFSEPESFVRVAGRLVAPDGVLLAMSGRRDQAELLPAGYRLDSVYDIQVPGLAAQRHVLRITHRHAH